MSPAQEPSERPGEEPRETGETAPEPAAKDPAPTVQNPQAAWGPAGPGPVRPWPAPPPVRQASPPPPPGHGPPPPISPFPDDAVTRFFRSFMPGARDHAPGLTLVAVAVIAVFAAVTTPGYYAGLSVTLTGLAVLGLTLRHTPTTHRPIRLVGIVLAAGLLAVPTVRDAGWIVFLCLVTAAGIIAVVAAPPVRFTGFLLGPPVMVLQWAGSLVWAVRGIREAKSPRGTGRAIRAIAIAAALLLVFGALFASADDAFADLIESVFPDLSLDYFPVRVFVFGLTAMLALGLAFLAAKPLRLDLIAARPARPVARWEWAVPLTALNVLFAAFVAVQATAFFGGGDYVRGEDGPTYAEHARGGFWQLCGVTILTLLVIAVTVHKAPRRSRADRMLLRGELGALCALSLVVVASALYRMQLYFDAYGLTRLRVWVFAVELWLALVFVLIVAAGIRLRARWLPRTVVATGALALLALAALNPDALIARHNVDRWEATGKIDANYLGSLSLDAVPEVMELDEPLRTCVLNRLLLSDDGDTPLTWNLARANAPERKVADWYVVEEQCETAEESIVD